ncbi:MAG: alpha/beta hydrolase [Pseudomonadota bacterium]
MTPLVLVHGFLGGGAQWQGQVDAFGATRDVIAVDLPGFGANAHLSALDTIVGFAEYVIERLSGLGVERYHLLGHSMGGMIVQDMARRDAGRVDQLILYATGATGVLPGRFETIQESKDRAVQDGPKPTARRIAATWFLDRDSAPGFEPCATIAEQASLDAIYAGLDAMEAWSGADKLPAISQDTLVIWSQGDRSYGWPQIEQLWTSIPNCSLAVVPGCAHAIHLEKPDLFNAVLVDFLR